MKFIHTGDLHIGATPEASSPYSSECANAVSSSLGEIVKLCNKEQADLLLISGDLFNRPPLRSELKEVAYLFSLLEKTRVVLIAGNHDYLSENSIFLNYNLGENVFFLSSPELTSVYFQDLICEVHGLSYYNRTIKEPIYDDLKPKNDGRLHILLAHGGDKDHAPINFKKLAGSGFDYIALGHIHQPSFFENTHMAYCGSPKPLDRTDIGKRGCLVGNITKDSFYVRFEPLATSIYRKLDIEMTTEKAVGQVVAEINEAACAHPKDLFVVNITGEIDPEVNLDIESLSLLNRVIAIEDNTRIAFDYDELCAQHREDIVSHFIKSFDINDPEQKLALDYGLKALLKL